MRQQSRTAGRETNPAERVREDSKNRPLESKRNESQEDDHHNPHRPLKGKGSASKLPTLIMREIKFIVKNILTGKWEGYTLQDLIEGKAKGIALENWRQYTGLKDKNGKEIYEGDIVSHKGQGYHREAELYIIRWKQTECGFVFSRQYKKMSPKKLTFNSGVKVVGNIYENSNLLKEK